MEYLAALAPIAFVFAIAALSQIMGLKKELEELKKRIEKENR